MKRIAWLITGSLSAVSLPGILYNIRTEYESLEVDPYLTKRAETIVTPVALATLAGAPIRRNHWSESDEVLPQHITLEKDYDAFVVAPATLSFLTQFITHNCSTPFSLALQCTKKPIVVAPSLPPGGISSIAYRRVEQEVSAWENLFLLPPIEIPSATNPQQSSAGFGSSARLIDFILNAISS